LIGKCLALYFIFSMNKNTRQNLYIALTYSLTLIGGMFLGYKFLREQGYTVEKNIVYADDNAEKVDEILTIINRNYVDDVNTERLLKMPIDSMLHQLDPHSVYLPPAKAFEQAEVLQGQFEGIGIEYYVLNDSLLVTNVIKHGPAFDAGLKIGDRILKVDNFAVSGRSLPRAKMIGRIKGKRGTPVSLTILHSNASRPEVLTVKRGKVQVSSIDAAYLLNNETAYVRISKFGANTDQDFVESVRKLKEQGMTKLILDLRDNGGGYLTAATGLASQLLPENELIVYTEGKHEPRTDYIATGGGEFESGKLAVLINEHTASASEILAGAVQDLDRGIIIGRRSFGKGLVQEQFPFGDGSALNLTIARYYTPLGRSIQKSYKNGYNAYQKEVDDRFVKGELSERSKTRDSIKGNTAYITASGKRVFGGGGIQPDLYVKMDTAGVTKLYTTLIEEHVLFDYVFERLAKRYNPAYLEQTINTFSISETDVKDLVKYLRSKDIAVDQRQLAVSRNNISSDLKLLLYKYHLGEAGYYKALNVNDRMVKQALSSLQ
jgi:carboxyl-terminal processing protease